MEEACQVSKLRVKVALVALTATLGGIPLSNNSGCTKRRLACWPTGRSGTPVRPRPPPPLSPTGGDFAVLLTVSREEDSEYRQWLNSRAIEVAADDSSELDQYYRQSIALPVDDPVQWWISHRQTFPTLSKLALDILAIPAMATDCERTFSLAKLTLTSQRLSMAPSRLEEVQCLKNWLRGGSVAVGGHHFVRRDRG